MSKRDELAEAAMLAQIEEAVDSTSKEIFASAFGDEEFDQDETGDRSIEAMGDGLEGQHEADEDDTSESDEDKDGESDTDKGETKDGEGKEKPTGEKGETKEEPKGEAKVDATKAEQQGRIPPGRLRETSERARTAEAERDTLKTQLSTRDTEFKSLADKLDLAMRQIDDLRRAPRTEAKAAEPAKVVAPPDPLEDPKGFIDHVTKGFLTELQARDRNMEAMRVDTSIAIAHARHGDAVDKAIEAIKKLDPRNPDDQMTVRRIYSSANPGQELVTWHKRNETLREVGDDPGKFRERLQNETREKLMKDPEFRKQLLAELRAEAEGDEGSGRPANTTLRLPRSLNGAHGGTSREAIDASTIDASQQGIFDSAWRG